MKQPEQWCKTCVGVQKTPSGALWCVKNGHSTAPHGWCMKWRAEKKRGRV